MADEVPLPVPPEPGKFARGAKPTPRHILAAACPFEPIPTLLAPAQFAVVPPQLSMWDNDRDGCCVTTEEAFAKAAWAVMNGLTELFVPVAEVIRWASKYGYLNGAYLTEVMDTMARDGFNVNGTNYHTGPYKSVDYSNEAMLQAALLIGTVKIAIDADALPSTAGNQQGWYKTGGSPGQYGNTDHCVALTGFGPASYLYSQLNVPIPSGLDPNKSGYLLFTWSTIGFVDQAWLMSTCTEAWVRNPTTPEQAPAPIPPVPPVPPVPPIPPIPPVPVNPGVVVIPQLTVRIFGLGIGHTDTVTVPVTQAGVGLNINNLIVDVLQLAADVKAGNWIAVFFTDVPKVIADIRGPMGRNPIRAVNWTQLWTDLSKLYADFQAGAGITVLWADLKAIAADLGF